MDTSHRPSPTDAPRLTSASERVEELLGMLDRIYAVAEAGMRWLGPDDGQSEADPIVRSLFDSIAREARNAEPVYTLQRYVEARG